MEQRAVVPEIVDHVDRLRFPRSVPVDGAHPEGTQARATAEGCRVRSTHRRTLTPSPPVTARTWAGKSDGRRRLGGSCPRSSAHRRVPQPHIAGAGCRHVHRLPPQDLRSLLLVDHHRHWPPPLTVLVAGRAVRSSRDDRRLGQVRRPRGRRDTGDPHFAPATEEASRVEAVPASRPPRDADRRRSSRRLSARMARRTGRPPPPFRRGSPPGPARHPR